ncbi:MAG TPA: YceI family protein [Balneolaceae bacterium]|nr:YceI family protein [Balneolaceae bacterium]
MYIQKTAIALLVLLFSAGTIFAQEVTYTLQDNYEMKIDGDSNVKSWDAEIKEMDGELVLTNIDSLTFETLAPEHFVSLNLTIPVENVESSSGGLTKNMQKYLEKDDHPFITFQLSEVTAIEKTEDSALITATGVINAAGQDHTAEMTVEASMNGQGEFTFSGDTELLMTSFDIDPPTAVFGTIRAKDEIVISFNTTFSN